MEALFYCLKIQSGFQGNMMLGQLCLLCSDCYLPRVLASLSPDSSLPSSLPSSSFSFPSSILLSISVLVCFAVAVINPHDQKHLEQERIYLASHPSHSPSLREVRAGTQKQVGADAGAMEEQCLLAHSSWRAQLAFLYNPQAPPRHSSTHCGLGLPHQSLT